MFSLDDSTIYYYGQNKVGACAEVLHDLWRCKRRTAIDVEVECKAIQQDFDECSKRTKQKAALEKIKLEMKQKEPIWRIVLQRILRF